MLMSFAANATPPESLQQQKEALRLLEQFTNEMCEQVPIKGSQTSWVLSGELSAKLKGIVKALVDAGVSGAAKYSNGDYDGLLQRDLLPAQQSRNACRKYYFDSLQDKLFGYSGGASKKPQANSADVLLTFDDFSFDNRSSTLYLRGVFNNGRSSSVTVTAVTFSARSGDNEGFRVIGEQRWNAQPLSPHTATSYLFAVPFSSENASYLAQRKNLPQHIFVDLRAVSSSGNISLTRKHFMTLDAVEGSPFVLGTLFVVPHAILRDTSPIHVWEKSTFGIAKALLPIVDGLP